MNSENETANISLYKIAGAAGVVGCRNYFVLAAGLMAFLLRKAISTFLFFLISLLPKK